jgi:hypothetical protein
MDNGAKITAPMAPTLVAERSFIWMRLPSAKVGPMERRDHLKDNQEGLREFLLQ